VVPPSLPEGSRASQPLFCGGFLAWAPPTSAYLRALFAVMAATATGRTFFGGPLRGAFGGGTSDEAPTLPRSLSAARRVPLPVFAGRPLRACTIRRVACQSRGDKSQGNRMFGLASRPRNNQMTEVPADSLDMCVRTRIVDSEHMFLISVSDGETVRDVQKH